MAAKKLTDRAITATKAPASGRVELHDGQVPGLVLRITANDIRTWSVVYRRRSDGKKRRYTLGPYPSIELAVARQRGHDVVAAVWAGRDPVAEEKSLRQRLTFGGLVKLYLARHARRKLRTAGQIESRLNMHVLPEWEDRAAADISRADVVVVLERVMADGKGPLANRLRQLLSSVFGWGVSEGLLTLNPVSGVRPRTDEKPRERFLDEDEIRSVFGGLDAGVMIARHADVIRLCLMTGQRVGEVAGIRVAEIDPRSWIWTLPAERSKNARAHTVPLVGEARRVVERWLADASAAQRKWLFGTTTGKPMSATNIGTSLLRVRSDLLDEPFTAHDLRRTVATHLARLGIDRLTIGAILNHITTTKAGITGSVYDRHERIEEKRRALQAWDAELTRIVSGKASDNVLRPSFEGRA